MNDLETAHEDERFAIHLFAGSLTPFNIAMHSLVLPLHPGDLGLHPHDLSFIPYNLMLHPDDLPLHRDELAPHPVDLAMFHAKQALITRVHAFRQHGLPTFRNVRFTSERVHMDDYRVRDLACYGHIRLQNRQLQIGKVHRQNKGAHRDANGVRQPIHKVQRDVVRVQRDVVRVQRHFNGVQQQNYYCQIRKKKSHQIKAR